MATPSDDKTCKKQGHPSRILFGSCNSQAYPQPLWPAVVARNATAWVWAGDAIYSDPVIGHDYSTFPAKAIIDEPTPERLHELYQDQKQHEGYKQLLEHDTFVTGTWDDHDFGTNNGDSTFPLKRESAIAFVDFLGEPKGSPMYRRAHEGHGIYGVKLIDFERPFGSQVLTEEESGIDPDVDISVDKQVPYSNRSVAVFVLDVRSFKTPWTKLTLDPDGDFLGERQWKWLEQALERSNATVNVVVQGLQVHADRHPDANTAESWSRFPRAQQRLYDLLLEQETPSILVSGDVHMAELLRKDCRKGTKVKSLPEVTTSGMTHAWGSVGTSFCSRPSSMFLCRYSYANWVLKQSMHFAHYINPLNDVIISDQGEMQYALDLNFAEFEFDWDNSVVIVTILGEDGVELLKTEWSLDDLKHGLPGSLAQEEDYQAVDKSYEQLGLPTSQWTCVNYRGVAHPYHRPIALTFTFLMPVTMLLAPMIAALVIVAWLVRRLLRKGKAPTQT